MLYVFQVDTGMMMTFEMQLAMESVAGLRKAIARKTCIPEDKQVLLISGGENLNPNQRVCSYSSAGTDTSPIFLFAKINIESSQPPIPQVDYGNDADLTEMIESCMAMQPSYDTLVARTELAANLYEQAAKQKEICERLVHDQHLQQQGWAAVTANLEDLTRAFRNKAEMLLSAFSEFMKNKSSHQELIDRFALDIQLLSKIPILPSLIEHNKLQTVPPSPYIPQKVKNDSNNKSMTGSSSTRTTTNDQKSADDDTKKSTMETSDELAIKSAQSADSINKGGHDGESSPKSDDAQQQPRAQEEPLLTLHQWIDYHDSHSSLEQLVELCIRGLDRFTENSSEQIKQEVHECLISANNSSMKEVRGLEERLFGLEKLMVDAKKVVAEQNQLAASFLNNKDRVVKVRDMSILPELSASHKRQLQMMLNNHQKMADYRGRCAKAKQELSMNLHARLRWIMYVEQQLSDVDAKLMIYRENLVRLNRQLEIVEQVHRAPSLYLESVVEVLRRRRFSKSYLEWSTSLAKKSKELYEEELERRKQFDQKIDTHFLYSLFPGLRYSYPPPFAIEPPEVFDTELPFISPGDVQYLAENTDPRLAAYLKIPKDVQMPRSSFDDTSNDRNKESPGALPLNLQSTVDKSSQSSLVEPSVSHANLLISDTSSKALPSGQDHLDDEKEASEKLEEK